MCRLPKASVKAYSRRRGVFILTEGKKILGKRAWRHRRQTMPITARIPRWSNTLAKSYSRRRRVLVLTERYEAFCYMNVDIPVSKKTMTAPPAQYASKGTELEEEESLCGKNKTLCCGNEVSKFWGHQCVHAASILPNTPAKAHSRRTRVFVVRYVVKGFLGDQHGYTASVIQWLWPHLPNTSERAYSRRKKTVFAVITT